MPEPIPCYVYVDGAYVRQELRNRGQREKGDRERLEKYFNKLSRLPDTHVVLGEVRGGKPRREQKGVDVQMAVDAFAAAILNPNRAIALVAGDADFAPLARVIRGLGPHVFVCAFSGSLAETLRLKADRVHLWDEPPSDWGLG